MFTILGFVRWSKWQELWRDESEKIGPYAPKVILGLIVLVSLYQALCHTEAFVDDAAISFSYSRQLAVRGELIHTASSERVEGFSNPSWTVLCALPFLLRMDPYIFARALGLMALLGSIWLVWRITGRLCPRSGVTPRYVAVLLTGLAPCVGLWTMAGLEAPLVYFLMALLVHQSLREELEGKAPRVGLVLAALALTRPEGVIYAAPVAFYKLLRWWRPEGENPTPLRHHLTNLVCWATPIAVYLGFRRLYFAAWLPNTFYTKTGALEIMQPAEGQRPRGVRYILLFLGIYRLGPALLASPLAAAVRGRWPESLLVLGLAATHLTFVYWADGDWMGDFRFFAMAMPVYALLLGLVMAGAGELIARLGERIARRRGRSRERERERRSVPEVIGRVVSIGLGLSFVFFGMIPTLTNYGRTGWVSMELVRHQGRTFELLARERGLPRATVALPDVGGSALGTHVEVLDTVGLVDRVIARHKNRPDRIRQYLFEEARPDFYQEHSHWKRYYNLPLHFELDRDYVQLPESLVDDVVLLGDNFIRREHLTAWPAEIGRRAEVELGRGMTLRGWNDPLSIGDDLVLILYVETGGQRPEAGDRLVVELRTEPCAAPQRDFLSLTDLPPALFDQGAVLRLRATAEAAPVTAFRLSTPEGVVTPWQEVRTVRAGEVDGADPARFVLHPRTHLGCGAGPERWRSFLRARGRIQRFDECRSIHRPEQVRGLVDELRRRAMASVAAGWPRPAVELLERAILIAPRSRRLEGASQRAAELAYARANEAADRGELAQAQALCALALRANPRLAVARTLDLELTDRGLAYFTDARERLETARDRLDRQRDSRAVRELLQAALAAGRPLDALLELEAREIQPRGRAEALLEARALLALGLCRRATERLEAAHVEGCEAGWLLYRAQRICGQPESGGGRGLSEPSCAEPEPEAPPVRSVFELDGDLPGWEISSPLEPPERRQRVYVSGSSGRGLLRTDRAPEGIAGRVTALSPELVLDGSGLSLQVGGGREADGVRVVLLVDGREVRAAAGQGDPHLRRVTWDVSEWVGQRARLRVEDRGGEPWGYLMIDHVRTHPIHLFDPDRQP